MFSQMLIDSAVYGIVFTSIIGYNISENNTKHETTPEWYERDGSVLSQYFALLLATSDDPIHVR